ncbi:MAG: AbrB/MazE/SpoVT family DNA-binding domain-containing protein [Erysipelotrichaceae bacterium]|nr:AbrB/MazE/SpoVT family DNA-binding domain-containing protein [Erysipelotrichaceae bacterium]
MKATGIVRRLDDLGRLVIPKEIRRIYRLKEGDSIEFYVSEQSEIILKKYSYLNDEKETLTRMAETLKEVTKCEVLFLLEDEIIGNDNILPDDCSHELMQLIRQYHPSDFESLRLFPEISEVFSGSIYPVVADSHWLGAFLLYTKQGPLSTAAKSAAAVMSAYLTKQFEH